MKMTRDGVVRDLRLLLPFAIIALTLYMQWYPLHLPYLLAYVAYSGGRFAGDLPFIIVPFVAYYGYTRWKKKSFPAFLVFAWCYLFSEIVNECLQIAVRHQGAGDP
jgi:hypothetical protein